MNRNRAVILGATGLVGNRLVNLLLEDDEFEEIRVFVRRPIGLNHPKVKEFIVDFEDTAKWKDKVCGDVLFLAFGTTIKKAGSKENQYKVDYIYQFQMAKVAKENGIKSCVLVSSGGASKNSKFFYHRIKGELDESIKGLTFEKLIILKPSVLVGKRTEFRFWEQVGIHVGKVVALLPGFGKFKPIHASIVAQAMINSLKIQSAFLEVEYKKVFDLLNNKGLQ